MDISDAESDDYDVDVTDDEWAADDEWGSNCCSCSKFSSCKTKKCKCRAIGNNCGKSCGCLATKCANRDLVSPEEPPHFDIANGKKNDSNIEETNKDRLLATQGAELLQSALVEKPVESNSDHQPRKPLSDIGNTLVCVSHPLNVHLDYTMSQ